MGVHAGKEVLSGGVGVGIVKEVIVLTDFGITAVFGVHPVDGCALDLPAIGGISATGIGVIGSQNLGDVSAFIGNEARAGDQVSTL